MISYLIEYNRYLSLIGIAIILGIAYLFSHNRKQVNIRLIAIALSLQALFGFLVLRTTIGRTVVQGIAYYVNKTSVFVDVGSRFVFGSLSDASGPWGFVFAFKVLPITIFFAAFMALLFHYNVIQMLMSGIRIVIQPLLKTSGAETLVAFANSFLGQTEAPLLIRHYLNSMTRSEMMLVMVSGMGTLSGALIIVYSQLGVPVIHLLAASVMGVPATIAIAKILMPETEHPVTAGDKALSLETDSHNVFDAVAKGTLDGLQIALCVAAFLISFLSLFTLADYMLNAFGYYLNELLTVLSVSWQLPSLSFELLFGYLGAPFAYLLGFTGDAAFEVGGLLGIKLTLNEMIAYLRMVKMNMPERSLAIVTYALAGFANFSSIGIQVGGIGALATDRRKMLTQLGLYAVLGGTLANLLSAMVAALLI